MIEIFLKCTVVKNAFPVQKIKIYFSTIFCNIKIQDQENISNAITAHSNFKEK